MKTSVPNEQRIDARHEADPEDASRGAGADIVVYAKLVSFDDRYDGVVTAGPPGTTARAARSPFEQPASVPLSFLPVRSWSKTVIVGLTSHASCVSHPERKCAASRINRAAAAGFHIAVPEYVGQDRVRRLFLPRARDAR